MSQNGHTKITPTKEFFRAIFDDISDGICIIKENKIWYANKVFKEQFGDVLNKFCYSVFYNRNYQCKDCHFIDFDKKTICRGKWISVKTKQTFNIFKSSIKDNDENIYRLITFREVHDNSKDGAEEYYAKLKKTNRELQRINASLCAANKRLERLSIKDELTGLYNHRYFWEALDLEFKRAIRYNTSLSCIMLDIDFFKSVNDLGSHAFGDYVLNQLGSLIYSALRATDVAARYGGEEFAVILPSTDYNGARIISKKIKEKIQSYSFKKGSIAMDITVSIGIASFPEDKVKKKTDLVQMADHALYSAKRKGRNMICLYHNVFSIDQNLAMGKEKLDDVSTKIKDILRETKRTYIESTKNLIFTVEEMDKYRKNHSSLVSYYSARIAQSISLTKDQVETIAYSGLLHDIGRLGISAKLFNKPDRLTKSEFDIVKKHAQLGAELIRPFKHLHSEYYNILHHHEYYNGTGYPFNLKGNDIPLGARILCLADAYVAMMALRPYRKAYSLKRIKEEIISKAGIQFDPNLVWSLIKIIDEDNAHPGFLE
ncbi:MAG: diguanylate cyclase [bacterium]